MPYTPPTVLVDRPATGVMRVAIDRPAHRNALTPETREALRDAIEAAVATPDVRCIVLTGTGGHFCAGGDIARLAALPRTEVAELLRNGHRLVRALIESPKPVIAAIEGAAAGGGAGLALACDLVVMAPDARLVLPFNRLGLVPDYGLAWTLSRRLGPGRAHGWMLRPRPIGAAEAIAIGLADVVQEGADFQAGAVAIAETMAAESPHALAGIKRLMLAQRPALEETLRLEVEVQERCFASEEFTSGAQAFLSRASSAAPQGPP